MSLAAAAHHLASKGRHGDSMLVHMTPREVAGLHALARAHGKKITINPETGLPEAFSLESLLPMLAGAALSFIPGVGPFMAAGIVGAGSALASGNLQKGLLDGLGAWGGASLAGGIMGAGAQAITSGAETAAASGAAGAGTGVAGTGAAGAAPASAAGSVGGTGAVASPVAASNVVGNPLGPLPTSGNVGMDQLIGADGMTSAPITASAQPAGVTGSAATDGVGSVAQPSAASSQPDMDRNQMDIASDKAAPGQQALREAGRSGQFREGLGRLAANPEAFMTKDNAKYAMAAAAPAMFATPKPQTPDDSPNPYRYTYSPGRTGVMPDGSGREQVYFRPRYQQYADGGLADLALESRRRQYSEGVDRDYEYTPGKVIFDAGRARDYARDTRDPITGMTGGSANAMRYLMGMPAAFKMPKQTYDTAGKAGDDQRYIYNPRSQTFKRNPDYVPPADREGEGNDEGGGGENGTNTGTNPVTNLPTEGGAKRGGLMALAMGGASHLGDYSDGGRLLRGPGDGVSDSIPATIADKRPARLADGEFVIPARIVSELGNGSTDAGARKLYAMMDRIQQARNKTVGKGKVAVNSRAEKMLPA